MEDEEVLPEDVKELETSKETYIEEEPATVGIPEMTSEEADELKEQEEVEIEIEGGI